MNFLTVIVLLLTATRTWQQADRIKLEHIEQLTFFKDRVTNSRRIPPISQTLCSDGDGCAHYEPDVIVCENLHANSRDVQWRCRAPDIPADHFKLGQIEVSCEGYDSNRDQYVLKGSCGINYSLHLTPAGRDRYGHKELDPYRRFDSSKHKPHAAVPLLRYAGIILLFFVSVFFLRRFTALIFPRISATRSTTPQADFNTGSLSEDSHGLHRRRWSHSNSPPRSHTPESSTGGTRVR